MNLSSVTKAFVLPLFVALAGCGGGGDSPALSASERDGLAFTREEEKLARDVYDVLNPRDAVFVSIEQSEQTHMDAVATLLARYDVADPASGRAAGEFTNPQLQALYHELVATGASSLQAALAVGVAIEELDIRDIESARSVVTHSDVLTTYDHLTRGSRNHLRTFYGRLVAAGGSYTPKYLAPSVFQAIVESPPERGP